MFAQSRPASQARAPVMNAYPGGRTDPEEAAALARALALFGRVPAPCVCGPNLDTFFSPLMSTPTSGATGPILSRLSTHFQFHPEALVWLRQVGGPGFERLHTELDLLVALDKAPDALTFGLAHGYFSDWVTYGQSSPDNHYRLTRATAPIGVIVAQYQASMLDRAHALDEAAEDLDPEFFEQRSLAQSRAGNDTLVQEALRASPADDYSFGQIVSWLLLSKQRAMFTCAFGVSRQNMPLHAYPAN